MVTPSRSSQFNKNLKYSIVDGAAHASMLGLTQDYMVPFALALKATTAQVGLLTSIPNLIMALSQLAAPRLTEFAGGRKKIILPAVFLHAMMWIPVMLAAYVFPEQRITWLIAFYTMTVVLGSMPSPAWGSMMADIVPERIRGRYFGFRNRICSMATLAFSFVAGGVLHIFTSSVLAGFSLLFGGAALLRLVSLRFLSGMHEPPVTLNSTEPYRPFTIMKNLRKSNLGRFILYIALMNLAVNISGPFFAVYMLRDLNLGYGIYVIVAATATVSNLVFMTFWGKRADRVGNIRVLQITAFLVPVVPMMWLIGHQVYFLIAAQVFSGFAWSGFNLVSTNFMYDAAPPEKRTQYLAVANAMNGGAICLGALLGAQMAIHLPPVFGYRLLTLFLTSGLLRGMVSVIMLRYITEVRHVTQTGTAELLFRSRVRPRKGPRLSSYPLSTLSAERTTPGLYDLRKDLSQEKSGAARNAGMPAGAVEDKAKQ